jgi:hypothetical protein
MRRLPLPAGAVPTFFGAVTLLEHITHWIAAMFASVSA